MVKETRKQTRVIGSVVWWHCVKFQLPESRKKRISPVCPERAGAGVGGIIHKLTETLGLC